MDNHINLIKEIKEADECLNSFDFDDLEELAPYLEPIAKELGLDSARAAGVFVVIFQRQCTDLTTGIDDLADCLDISALSAMELVPAINDMVMKGILSLTTSSSASYQNKKYAVDPDLFCAIVENREINREHEVSPKEYDSIMFCKEVNKRKYLNAGGKANIRCFISAIEDMENAHSDLTLISGLKSIIDDIRVRIIFYEICNAYICKPEYPYVENINDLIENIYDNPIERISAKVAIKDHTHPLVKASLASGNHSNFMRLSAKGIKLLFGDNASQILSQTKINTRYDFVDEVSRIVGKSTSDSLDSGSCDIEMEFIDLEGHSSLTMVETVKNLLPDLEHRILFYLIASDYTNKITTPINELGRLYDGYGRMMLKRDIQKGTHGLITSKLVKIEGSGMYDDSLVTLSEKGKEVFLEEDIDIFEDTQIPRGLIIPDDIAKKQLFFDGALERQLLTLQSCLSADKYEATCRRLDEKGLHKGIAALLYGQPGTGKTEWVMQLARITGRPLLHVDISSTKNCWFGESEKQIKEIFVKYKRLCDISAVRPILFFNEADAIFAKRKDTTSSTVAQTENAMQNIILEEMEKLEGILIATTNMADNLDRAFERRFLFKIRFDRPSESVKQRIWMEKVQSLTQSEALSLASRYDFSGGDIDNISRKIIINEVIGGVLPSIENITTYCEEEKISSGNIRVGF